MTPYVRASHCLAGIAVHSVLGEDVAARIRQRAADAIATVEAAPRGAWLPVQTELAIVEAIATEAGLDGVRRRVARQLQDTADGPLLRPVREGATRLMGLNPGALLRFAGVGWRSSFADCGSLAFEPGGAQAGVLHYREAPPLLLAHPAWHACIAGAVEGVFALCHTTGAVTITTTPADVRLAVSWTGS